MAIARIVLEGEVGVEYGFPVSSNVYALVAVGWTEILAMSVNVKIAFKVEFLQLFHYGYGTQVLETNVVFDGGPWVAGSAGEE